MTEQVSLKTWGNSYGIRIPKKMMEVLHLKNEDPLLLETDGDKIIIRKKFRHKTFEERLSEYEGQISVVPFDWGEPKGRELF